MDIAEWPVLAGILDALRVVLAKPPDHPQAKSDRRLALFAWLQAAIPVAEAHIQRADFQAVAARVLEDLVRAVETHRPAVDQGAGEGGRLMAFQPATGVSQQGEAGGVGFGEAVAAKALDLLEDARGEFCRV